MGAKHRWDTLCRWSKNDINKRHQNTNKHEKGFDQDNSSICVNSCPFVVKNLWTK